MSRLILRQCILACAAVSVFGIAIGVQGLDSHQQADHQTASAGKKSSEDVQRRGEAVFQANCGRCHNPPSSIPPHITGTVVMHMRTRAKLSREDEQALLRFLAP